MGKIAFIAPYEEIFTIGKKVVADLGFSDRVDCYLGWLGKGVEIARKLEADGADVIISRGGTAELIARSGIQVPVVEIPISFQDLAEVLLKVKEITALEHPRIAVLAFRNMMKNIDVFVRVMNLDLLLYELDSEEEIPAVVERAYNEHADILIGGIQTTMLASARGMKTLLITSGEDSYRAAVLQADKVSYARTLEKERMQKFRVLVDYSIQGIIGIDSDRRISVFNTAAERLLGLHAQNILGKTIDEAFPDHPFSFHMKESRALIGELIQSNDKKLIANLIPIDVGGSVSGAMITVEDVGRIVEMEANIRKEIYSKGLYAQYRFSDIKGSSPQIEEAKRVAREYAATDATVLISGASGTGKELFAQSIHNAGRRSKKPFIAVNCGAIPATLMESELFGYAEGAFTGAMKKGKPGLFELAHGGTIFLDEISEMDKLAQTSLLRVIQERRVMRVGGDRYLPVDVRIIAATNKNLQSMVEQGQLREDLYYRLNVLPLEIPPLSEREGDALHIANTFLDQYNRMFGKQLAFSADAKAFIRNYAWPGNVRQLRNHVERLVVVTKGKVIGADLSKCLLDTATEVRRLEKPENDSSERSVILRALAQSGFNQNDAAKKLGIDRSTLYRKMRKFNIEIKKLCDKPDK